MRDLSTYAFINARIRAMYSDFLSPTQCERLAEARDVTQIIEFLQYTPYRLFISEQTLKEKGLPFIEQELIRHNINAHQKVIKDTPKRSQARKVVMLLRERYEVEEVKGLLRCWHSKDHSEQRPAFLQEAFVHSIHPDKIVSAIDIDALIELFKNTPYQHPILSSKEKYKEKGSVFYIESALEHDYFLRLWQEIDQLSGSDRTAATRLLGIEIDIENINTLIRLRHYYDVSSGDLGLIMLPRGYKLNEKTMRDVFLKSGVKEMIQKISVRPYHDLAELFSEEMDGSNLFVLEGLLYQTLCQEAQKMLAGFPFTIGTLLAYLILKKAETRKIISLLYAKTYGFQPDHIKGAITC